jgi:hypothetical protein
MTEKESLDLAEVGSKVLDKFLDKVTDPEKFVDNAGKLIIDFQNSLREVMVVFFTRNIIYKTSIQSGRRISIPPEEMNSAGIKEGDPVQVIIIPLKHIQENKKGKGDVEDDGKE